MDQMRLSGRDEGINVVVSSLCAACDDPEKVIQSIKNIFPEFEIDEMENDSNIKRGNAAKEYESTINWRRNAGVQRIKAADVLGC